jgi:hypothetical protein
MNGMNLLGVLLKNVLVSKSVGKERKSKKERKYVKEGT